MSQTIDAFAHVFPRDVYERMMEVYPTDELRALGSSEHFWDAETRLSDMDTFGIDKQVLTLARPPIWRGMSEAEKLELTRFANDAVRQYADEHPDRFIPVGTIPGLNQSYAVEAKRCIDELDMSGIQLFSNVGGNPIDSLAAESIFSLVAERDAGVWIHPQLHRWHEWDSEYMLHKMLGWPFDTSLALSRLVFSGIMERHPDLKIIPHHMGGMIPHFAARIRLVARLVVENPDMYPFSMPDFDRPPIEYFKRFYADTVRGGAPSILEDGVEFYGADRLVFATDYPFGPDNGRGFMKIESEALDAIDVDPKTRRKVGGENVLSIIGE